MANESFSYEEAFGLSSETRTSPHQGGGFSYEEAFGAPPAKEAAAPGFFPTIKRTGGQMLTTAATTAEDVVGSNAVTRAVHDTGQGIIDRNPAGIRRLSDLIDSPVLAVKEAVGQFAPQIGAAAAGGFAGARAGGAIGALAGPGGAATGAIIGGAAGSLLPIFTQEYGGIRQEQKEAGQEDKARALVAAIPATALERVGMGKALNVLKGVPVGAGSVLKEAGKGVLREGATEGAQNVIEQWGAFKDPTTGENLEDTALSAAMGGIGGGVVNGATGAVDGARGRAQERQRAQAEEQARGRANEAAESADQLSTEASIENLAGAPINPVDRGEPATFEDLVTPRPDEDPDPFTAWEQEAVARQAADKLERERQARAAGVDYQPGDTTPQWDTMPGAVSARGGDLEMPAPDFDTGSFGFESTSRALTPSQRMGIDPAAGPVSKVAAIAADSAAASDAQFIAATGRVLVPRRTGPSVTDESNVIDVQGRVVEDAAIGTGGRAPAQDGPINRTGQPLRLNAANALRMQAREAGMAAAVVPHASGRGYDVVPRLPAPAVVAAPDGAPFATPGAAMAELQRQQLGATHRIAPAGGDSSLGFVLEKYEENQAPALMQSPGIATESGANRAPNWRTNAMQAGRVARDLGFDSRGKRLAQIVAEIDAADAQRAGVRQDGADISSGQIDRSQPGSTAQVMRSLAQQFRDRHAVTQQDTDRTFAGVLEQFANEVEEGKRTPQSVQQAIARYQELAAQPVPATHADPGEKAEAATSAVVTDSLKTAARNEDTKPSEMRKWLVAEIDRAMLDAPEKDATEFVSFDVPGDGVFKVQKSRERLLEFRKKVMASPGFKDGGQRPNMQPPDQVDTVRNGSGSTVEAVRNFLADGDVQGAVEFAKLKGVEFTPVEPRASITANGKFKRVPASVKSSVPSVAEGLTQVEAEQINQYLTAEQARAEPADAQDADVQQSPQDFIPAPDGGLDYGEITPEMGKAMRSQARKQEADEKQARAANSKAAKQGAAEEAPISDFGEKLEGARKDMPPSLKEEVSDEKIASLPLSKIWPSDAHESIEDDAAAALVFAARKEIPAKPRVPSRVREWVSKVKTYLTLVKDLGKHSLERIEQLSKEKGFHSLDPFFAKVRLLSQLPRDTWSRVERVEEYPNAIRYEKDGSKTAVAFSSVTVDGKSHRFDGVGKIGPDEVQKVKEMLGTAAPKKGGLTAQDFEVRGTAKTGYKINRKGDSEYRSLKIFTGEDAAKKALAWRDEHTAELEAAWEAVKARDNVSKAEVRRDENRERTGENRRNGRDVNAEMFTDAFGFRGGQFGNWVGQGADAKSRQGMLNDAYDALLDLSDILGIPSRAISLNGTLGLSFGARGSGKAAAHFEPSNLVINLTKTRGAGSLAHEWFHALDNYFSRMRGGEVAFTGDNNAYRQNNFVTYKPEAAWGKAPITPYTNFMRGGQLRERLQRLPGFSYDANKTLAENAKAAGFERDPNHKDGVRPQVEKAFADLVQALNESPMAKRASSLDKAADGYWGRIIERGARSFENYVISKMAQRGWSNDFLANIRSFDEWMAMGKNAERYPYLKPEEDAPVVAAFDKLFETVETREGDGGATVLYNTSDSAPPARGLSLEQAQQAVQQALAGLRNAPPVDIVGRSKEVWVDAPDSAMGAAIPSERRIVIAASAHGSADAVVETLFHEMFHLGLRNVLPASDYVQSMLDLAKRDSRVQEYANKWKKEAPEAAQQLQALRQRGHTGSELTAQYEALAIEEGLAVVAEELRAQKQAGTKLGMRVRVLANWLASVAERMGMQRLAERIRKMTYNEAERFVLKAIDHAGRAPSNLGNADVPRYRAGDQLETPAFRDWFGDSKVVDGAGQPLRVFHGTGGDFNAFSRDRAGATTGAANAGMGFFFTDRPEVAGNYARMAGDAQNILPVYLSLKNPLRLEAKNMLEADRMLQSGLQEKHDGAIIQVAMRDGGTQTVYMVRESGQAKSATGNRGTFDPGNADIRYRTARAPVESSMGQMTAVQERVWKKVAGVARVPTLQERAKALTQNFGVRAKQALVDQFAPIQDVSQDAYMLARMSKGADGTMEAAMLYGRPYLRDGVPDVDVKDGGFAKVLASLKGEHDRFLWWVAAQRADRLKAEGKENLMSIDDIGVLETLNASTMADGTQRAPVYAKAAAQLMAFNESVLKMALESGLIDKVAYDIMKEQPYVPFYRLMAEEGGMPGARFSSGLTNQNFAKKLKGGTEQLNADLLENLLLNWSHLYAATARNRAAVATMDAAEKMGVAYPVLEPVKGSVRVMRDGQAQHWMVEDPYLLEAISALHYTSSPLMKPLAKMKQLLTWGVTVNPTFKIRNLMRDSLAAIAQSELGYNPAANVKRGWNLTAQDSQVYASMLASGGVIKFGTQENTERAREQVKKLGGVVLDQQGWHKLSGQLVTVWNAYSELGDRLENVNRVALYDRLVAQGHSHAEASFMARDLMDFSMSGNHAVVRFLTQSVPFLNARLQGLYKLGRAAHDNPRRFAAVAGAVSLASLALLAAFGDDEDWKKREDWDRDSYWWFKIGDQAYRIPKPFEVGAIGTLAERTAELMFSDEMTNRRFMERLGHMLAQTFSFDPMPQAFKPLVDIYSNQDSFTGRAIESQADQRLRPEDRYDERTSEVARLLGSWGLPDPVRFLKGEWSELSPKQVDHLLRGYFSWAGTTAAAVADTIARPALDRGDRPDRRLKDVFVLGNFVESLPSGSSRYVTQMYEQARQVEQAHASYRDAIKRGDLEKAEEIQRDEAPKLRQRPAYANATRQLSDLNQRAKAVTASKELSGAEKRAALDAIERQRAEVGHRMNALAIAP